MPAISPHKLNPAIENIPMPEGVRNLPVAENGFPVPWFVQWIDGKPEFRIMDAKKLHVAVQEKRCWVCGEKLDNRPTFLIGPMCVVNRISAEPPSHLACALYSVRACPFLARPGMVRRENNLPEGAESAGIMIARNPGVICLWTTRSPGFFPPEREPNGGMLFHVLPPTLLSFWREGRTATFDEVTHSVATGLPALVEMAEAQGPEAELHLHKLLTAAMPLFELAKQRPAYL